MVLVVQRERAAKNPRATFKAPITVEDALNSRIIALLPSCTGPGQVPDIASIIYDIIRDVIYNPT
jgi:acetyl-CoA acetyltransferase